MSINHDICLKVRHVIETVTSLQRAEANSELCKSIFDEETEAILNSQAQTVLSQSEYATLGHFDSWRSFTMRSAKDYTSHGLFEENIVVDKKNRKVHVRIGMLTDILERRSDGSFEWKLIETEDKDIAVLVRKSDGEPEKLYNLKAGRKNKIVNVETLIKAALQAKFDKYRSMVLFGGHIQANRRAQFKTQQAREETWQRTMRDIEEINKLLRE
jgi:hypothetical protein